jgi:hypothetical protein
MPARRGQARAVRNKSCPERRLAQSQSATRETRMQTYRAASASGGFANIDLNPRRPTTNRTAQDHQREKQITHKGSHQDASQINIPWCAHWISLKQVFQPIEEPPPRARLPAFPFLRQPRRCRSFLQRAVPPAGFVRS